MMTTCRALGIEMMDIWYTHTHTQPNQYVDKKMLQCYRTKGYTQTQK